ncbi:SRPBCC family protein [Kineosporia babensis]|uniref:SRPBCC domain-containing protein n=1 Tax=Kineosporia babensis TaxID=499548 RepID=A0A9X1SWI4_9ACTN|nr:SRPBCC domain-containing protein [Kineosporia babensis]MCD5314050.1 SRPBCC domain-containing protein [Kineosporia babensis]
MTERTSIDVEQFLPHAPARVWRALTDPQRLARWLMPNDFRAEVGHRFTFTTHPRDGFDGTVHCEVLQIDPERLMRWSWKGGNLDSTLTWTLAAEGHGTRLFLLHEGFDPDDPLQQKALKIMGGGWRSHILRALEAELQASA